MPKPVRPSPMTLTDTNKPFSNTTARHGRRYRQASPSNRLVRCVGEGRVIEVLRPEGWLRTMRHCSDSTVSRQGHFSRSARSRKGAEATAVEPLRDLGHRRFRQGHRLCQRRAMSSGFAGGSLGRQRQRFACGTLGDDSQLDWHCIACGTRLPFGQKCFHDRRHLIVCHPRRVPTLDHELAHDRVRTADKERDSRRLCFDARQVPRMQPASPLR